MQFLNNDFHVHPGAPVHRINKNFPTINHSRTQGAEGHPDPGPTHFYSKVGRKTSHFIRCSLNTSSIITTIYFYIKGTGEITDLLFYLCIFLIVCLLCCSMCSLLQLVLAQKYKYAREPKPLQQKANELRAS